jgi:erythromycin esterase
MRAYPLLLGWIALLLVLMPATGLRAQSPAEMAWLNQQLSPIQHVEPGADVADLLPLAPLVAQARVVGLGEATHGSHEFFQLKHRLLQYLVTQQGFTTLAIEADYGWGEILNDYIQKGQGDSLTVHSAAGFEIWNTTEFWEMVEWLRSYNQQHANQIRYVGVDMQDPYPNLFRLDQFATHQLDTVLRRRVRDLRTDYFALRQATGQAPANIKQRIKRLSEELAQHLQTAAAPVAMQQHARVLVQRAYLLQQGNGAVRDQAMATNVAWILTQEPRAKVVVWAHNAHIRRDAAGKRMGYYLAQQLGLRYVAVGFATGKGMTNVFEADGTFRPIPLLAPDAQSVEAWLNRASSPTYLLALRAVQAEAATKWLLRGSTFRQIGSAGARVQFLRYPPLPEVFDALLYVRQTSPSQSYRAAHQAK